MKRPSEENTTTRGDLLTVLRDEIRTGLSGGIHDLLEIRMAYHSNRIEGSGLSLETVSMIYSQRAVYASPSAFISTDDIVEASNHFQCMRMIIDSAEAPITPEYLKDLLRTLKNGTSDSMKPWSAIGEWKKLPNTVGGIETALPEEVDGEIRELIESYESLDEVKFDDILSFHVSFEEIHPFQDGNGRVGRLIMFKECMRHGIVPFIVRYEDRGYYYRGLREWHREKAFLRDTCLSAEDEMKTKLSRFRVEW